MNKIFLLTILFFISLTSWAEESSNSYNVLEQAGKHPNTLIKLIQTNPTLQSRYQECSDKDKNIPTDRLGDCLWYGKTATGLSTANITFEALTDEEKKKIQEDLLRREDRSEGPSTDSKGAAADLAGTGLTNMDRTEDPALAALKKHLLEKLEKAMYGEAKEEAGQQKRVIDHKVFYRLYKARVGKNIITSFSSYCMEADLGVASSPGSMLIPCGDTALRGPPVKTRSQCLEEQRKANIKKLSEGYGKSKAKGFYSDASECWKKCIMYLQDICHKRKPYDNTTSDNFKYSQGRACAVITYVKGLRQTLINLSEIKKKLDDFAKNPKFRGVKIAEQDKKGVKKEREIYTGENTKDSIDELTSLTSQEYLNATKGEMEKMSKEFEEKCRKGAATGDINQAECRKYLMSQDEFSKKKQLIAEFDTRTRAKIERLKQMKDEEVRAFARAEGFKDEDLDRVQDIQKLKDEITERYRAESKALIQELAEQLESRASKEKEVTVHDVDKIEAIAQELRERPRKMQQLIFFDNIVSSFLGIEDKGVTVGQNIASMKRELESIKSTSNNTSSSRSPAAGGSPPPTDPLIEQETVVGIKDDLKDMVASGGDEEEKEPETHDDVSLDVDTLNEHFLEYNTITGSSSSQGSSSPTP